METPPPINAIALASEFADRTITLSPQQAQALEQASKEGSVAVILTDTDGREIVGIDNVAQMTDTAAAKQIYKGVAGVQLFNESGNHGFQALIANVKTIITGDTQHQNLRVIGVGLPNDIPPDGFITNAGEPANGQYFPLLVFSHANDASGETGYGPDWKAYLFDGRIPTQAAVMPPILSIPVIVN